MIKTTKFIVTRDIPCYVFDAEYYHRYYDDHSDRKAQMLFLQKGYEFTGYLKSLCVDFQKIALFKNSENGKWYKFYWKINEPDPYKE